MILSTILKVYGNKENYKNDMDDFDNEMSYKNNFSDFLVDLIVIAICIYAAYLSWSCNTAKKISLPIKVFYSFFAFIFGLFYVVFYAIFKETLQPCKF